MSWRIIVGVLFCWYAFIAVGQVSPGLSKKFDGYQTIWPKNKLHLVFNQDKFSPGDTVWFKTYFLTRDLIGLPGKQLLHLNLVDSNGQSKLQFLFSVYNGIGHNQFAVPDDLPPGIYLVTAYSDWMKNFGNDEIFCKKIKIIAKKEIIQVAPFLKVGVEGGHLIRNVSGRVILITNQVKSLVQIVDAGGNKIRQDTTDINGMSSLIFTPGENKPYYVKIPEGSINMPLPQIEMDGCALHLIQLPNAASKIIVSAPSTSIYHNQELNVIISSRGRIYHHVPFHLDKSILEFPFLYENLPLGIAHVSLLDQNGALLASRDFYSHGSESVKVDIRSNKDIFLPRDKAALEIFLTDKNNQPVVGEFTLKVLNASLVEQADSIPFEVSLFTGAENKFSFTEFSHTALDNYLISFTKPIPWKSILSRQPTKPTYRFAIVIQRQGKAYFGENHEPVPDNTKLFFYLQHDKTRYQTFTANEGRFGISMLDVYGDDEFFYMAETGMGEEISDLKIEWDEETMKLPNTLGSKESESDDLYGLFASKLRLIESSFGFYNASPDDQLDNDPGNDFEYEIGGADVTINVQDYVLFATMEELVKEVIPFIRHRKRGGKEIVRMHLDPSSPQEPPRITTSDPIYIIDGIATRNTDFFLSLRPSELLTVKFVKKPKKLAPFGLMGKNGIVIVQTKDGNKREAPDPTKRIKGLNKPIDFRGPEYLEQHQGNTPDFRSTIHWEPSVHTDSNGKAVVEFYCSDDIGELSVMVMGISVDGRPFSARKALMVVPKP